MIRIVLVDDEALVRDGLRAIIELEDDLEVVGEGGDGSAAVGLVRSLKPDVVLLDVRMPVMDGLEAARRLLREPAAPRVVMLTTFDRDEYLYAAMQAGASGFLLKDMRRGQLTAAIHTVAAGNALIAPSMTRRLIEAQARRQASPEPAALAELTAREREVLALVARGLSNAEIAATLTVGESTVKTHVARILDKLDLRDRVQAVVLAYESGVVRPNPS